MKVYNCEEDWYKRTVGLRRKNSGFADGIYADSENTKLPEPKVRKRGYSSVEQIQDRDIENYNSEQTS